MTDFDPTAVPAPAPVPEPGRVVLALKPGQVIHEYRIERTLGGGGFGITYLAQDVNLKLPVALKEYLPADLATRGADGSVQSLGAAADEQFNWGLERFIDEARALAAFRHPHIVRVLRYFTANGTAYIVMEYESGHSLKRWLPLHAPIDRAALLRLIQPLLDGLELIHREGFLHRDIKPDNIYVRADGSPVLIDFGSARRTTLGRDLTNIVSPGFAPFEQYHASGHQGPWSDLYSLAAVMYWMVSGNKPVESASRLKNDPMVPAVRCGRADLMGEALLAAIDWALAPDETQRPQSVAEFRGRLLASSAPAAGEFAPTQLARGDTHVLGPGVSGSGSAPVSSPQRGNLVCSVLFLDIVGYSKTSVSEQYELKSRFNQLIAAKLTLIPENSRITVDTGDGAGICFLGDPEQVLLTAINIRSALSAQERLRVRMGLHIGPVRILNDMNGRGNVIGDGINAAQRVMDFADEHTLLVSRAFYDVVSRLSDGGERAFRYVGAQSDKHGRVHELYAAVPPHEVGVPAARTVRLGAGAETIDAAAVAQIERELMQQLGPLAPVLVRKARARAQSTEQMRELLALSIADPEQRQKFRLGRTGTGSDNSRLHTNPPSAPLNSSTRKPELRTQSPTMPVSQSGPSLRAWLPQETLTALEKMLAQVVGPVARVLIKNEVRKSADYASLCQALAAHIDDPQQRTRFAKDAAGLKTD